jgi:hypothetical protein
MSGEFDQYEKDTGPLQFEFIANGIVVEDLTHALRAQ